MAVNVPTMATVAYGTAYGFRTWWNCQVWGGRTDSDFDQTFPGGDHDCLGSGLRSQFVENVVHVEVDC
jgi:hypothetical protein